MVWRIVQIALIICRVFAAVCTAQCSVEKVEKIGYIVCILSLLSVLRLLLLFSQQQLAGWLKYLYTQHS